MPTNQKSQFEVQILRPDDLARIKKTRDRTKSVVTSTILPDKILRTEDDSEAKYLSEHRQRVKEEVHAAASGPTENRGSSQARPQKNNSNQGAPVARSIPESRSTKKGALSFDDLRPQNDGNLAPREPRAHRAQKNFGQPLAKLDNPGTGEVPGLSTMSEVVETKVGFMTSLNTDQYLFYSFFKRVKDLVYFRWVSRIEDLRPLVQKKLRASGRDQFLTEVDIWVNPNGKLHSPHILRSSGISDFDQAAVSAFVDASFFGNPPPELVEDDNFIHLRFGLTVVMSPE